ncbi:MAG: hypothetical protein ABIR26_03350, partial [Ramlibacter sp.]
MKQKAETTMKQPAAFRLALMCCTFHVAASAVAATVYVSPLGSDGNDGLAAATAGSRGPVATIGKALAVLRGRAAGGNVRVSDRIVLSAGVYELPEPVRLDARESRPAGAPLLIEAAKPGTVILSGGRALKPFADKGKYWAQKADAPAQFQILWVNEKLARWARGPKGGAFYQGAANVRPPVPEKNMFKVTLPENVENQASVILPPAARNELERLSDEEIRDAVLVAMHAWTSSTHQIAKYDAKTGRVDLKQPSKWPFLQFGGDQRFAIENAAGLMDEPGEWWLSPQGELRYLPLAGQTTATTRAVAPALEQLVTV